MIRIGPDFRLPPQFGALQLVFLIFTFQALERAQARTVSNYTLTSYYRDAQRNQLVGGVEGSLHTVGLAVDIDSDAAALFGLIDFVTNNVARRTALGDVVRFFRAIAPPFTQGVLEDDHAHLELDLS